MAPAEKCIQYSDTYYWAFGKYFSCQLLSTILNSVAADTSRGTAGIRLVILPFSGCSILNLLA